MRVRRGGFCRVEESGQNSIHHAQDLMLWTGLIGERRYVFNETLKPPD
jgi:hypothetical protein